MVATVISAIVIIIFIIIIIRIIKRNSKIIKVMPANGEQVISASSLGTTTGTTNNCTYSIWIYVNDWSVNYGDEKIIFQRGLGANPDLLVGLGDYETTLIVKTQILGKSDPTYYTTNSFVCGTNETPNFSCNVLSSSNCKTTCNEMSGCVGYQYDTDIPNSCSFVTMGETGATPNYSITPTYDTNKFYSKQITKTHKTCIVPNIEIQKWINIILSADTNGMDIYIDGNLIQSCDLQGEININNATNVYLSPGGKGFNGWNSKFQFWPKYINPRQAMNIYRRGSGSTNLGALNYKLKVSLNNGNTEMATANI